MFVRSLFCWGMGLLACFSTASAAPIAVGSGANTAHLVLNFEDGAAYEFDVSFDGTTTGLALFDIIEANTTLDTTRQTFSFGTAIEGISFDGHSDSGFGFVTGSDFWHYWVKASADAPWVAASSGPSDRVVTNSVSDGWVFGSNAAPIPEPASIAFAAATALILSLRRPAIVR